jgi:Tfp pilus assembly protein PilP
MIPFLLFVSAFAQEKSADLSQNTASEATPPVAAMVGTENDEVDLEQFMTKKESIANLRDPFRMPVLQNSEDGTPRSPLELVPIDRMKVLGVITGPDQFRAMIQDPGGQTFLVSEKMKLGIRKGVVKKITSKGLWIQEKVLNVLGQEETVDVVLKIEPLGKQNVGDSSGISSPSMNEGVSSSGG